MWEKLTPVKQLLPVQEVILSHFQKEWGSRKRHALVSPRQKVVNQVLIQLAITYKMPTLILCSDPGRYAEWIKIFSEEYGCAQPEQFISELKLEEEPTLFNLATYGTFCYAMNATAEERYQARSYREYELASVGAWDQNHDNIGDFDAVKETEIALNEEAIRQLSRYRNKLLRFIEIDPDENLSDTNWLNHNTSRFIEKLQANKTAFIICDESNEVTGIWAEVLYSLLQSFNTCHILSSSPIKINLHELSSRNYQLQTSLFDSTPYEVKLPLMVRDNCFKPYLGLMAVTQPSDEEQQFLNAASSYLKDALSEVEDKSRVGITLTQFALNELSALERDVPGYWAKRREYVESVLNFICYYSLTAPPIWNVFINKLGPIEFSKNLPVIRDYIFRCLLQSNNRKDHRLGEKLIRAFKPLGFELHEGRIELGTSLIPNILNRSSNKEELLTKYLTEEFINLQRDLKAVIVCDFIDNSSAAEIFPGNDFDSSSCGMMSILEKLELSPITLQLNPIVIYSDIIYFNPKFKTVLTKEIEKYAADFREVEVIQKQESGYCYISATGVKNFKHFWNPFFNRLIQKKITHCLIVSREFLSPKWDGINFNTYFNMSSATSELFGIRMLARILMYDNEPVSAKHLWDFFCIMPEIELGMADYLRVSGRKQHGWHLCEDGEFEQGISYFHPSLKTQMKRMSKKLLDEINETASRLIPTRQHTYDMWMAKHDHENFIREVLEITLDPATDPFKKFSVSRLKGKKSSTHTLGCKEIIESICKCMVDSLTEIHQYENEPTLKMTVRRPGVYRVEITNCSSKIKSYILENIQLLFTPINQQHYVVTISCAEEAQGNILSRLFSESKEKFMTPFALPEAFTKKNELGIILKNWQKTVSNDQMMGHRIPEVRKKVKEMQEQTTINLRPDCRSCSLLV